ncbi:MAG TPA: hypothetical protein VGD36_20440, partial [Xanthobacteraceae bacterium]
MPTTSEPWKEWWARCALPTLRAGSNVRAKARLRAVPTTSESVEEMVGTLRFAHPTGASNVGWAKGAERAGAHRLRMGG